MTVEVVTTNYGSYLQCNCDQKAIRLRTQSNGVKIYAEQCLDCGRQIRAVSKNAPEILEMPERITFDEALKEQWREREQAHRNRQAAEREQAQQEKSNEWWQWYNGYLTTPSWRLKRQMVLARANGLCEGCRCRQAEQVHHLTYKHAGNEFLFELVAVCAECHARLHED